jgi:hypothetical protein
MGRDQGENLDIDEKIILELTLEEQGGKVWAGLIWLRIGINGGIL